MANLVHTGDKDPERISVEPPLQKKSLMLLNIQHLRAFAAINVVLYHIIGLSPEYKFKLNFIDILDNWGANGVDIFFVISGFVMFHTQYAKRLSPNAFITHRIIRIYPLYFLITSLFISFKLLMPFAFKGEIISFKWAISSLLFLSQIATNHRPVIYVGWTLEYEMLFYVVFYFCLFLANFRNVMICSLLALISVCFLSGELIILEFFLGLLCGAIYHKYDIGRNYSLAFLIVGTVLLLASIPPEIRDFPMSRFFKWGIPSFLIVLGSLKIKQIEASFLFYLGNASYSIYLAQVFTTSFIFKIFARFFADLDGDTVAILCLIISVAGGCALHSFIEKPMTQYLRRYLR